MFRKINLIIGLVAFAIVSQGVQAHQLISVNLDKVEICAVIDDNITPPSFADKSCYAASAREIDPQNTAIWVKLSLALSAEFNSDKHPHSLYISGKTSSLAFFNGHLIGQNGTPSLAPKDEYPGKIDAMFYVPSTLIKPEANQLILKLSSHHGFLALASPINFIVFGDYADPSYFIQKNLGVSIIPLGALFLAALYFLVASFSSEQRQVNLLFLLMTSFAGAQLLAELARALYSYSYPLHDLRLLLIVIFSFSFGACLVKYILIKIESSKQLLWLAAVSLISLLAVIITPGFDGKTAIAILVPSIFCALLTSNKAIKRSSKEFALYALVFWGLVLTIGLTLTTFHGILFYYIITLVLGVLFAHQALTLNREQKQRLKEQQQIAKLQFKLDQNQHQLKPHYLKINSASKIELVASNEIIFCKAAGDYAELYLTNKKQLLFSGNLKELEGQLPDTFLRVHRSYLVNMNFICSLSKNSVQNQELVAGGGFLLLEGEFEVPVSRRIMPMVRNVVNQA